MNDEDTEADFEFSIDQIVAARLGAFTDTVPPHMNVIHLRTDHPSGAAAAFYPEDLRILLRWRDHAAWLLTEGADCLEAAQQLIDQIAALANTHTSIPATEIRRLLAIANQGKKPTPPTNG